MLKQLRVKGDGLEREGNGSQGEIVDGLVEIIDGAKGMRKVLRAYRRRLLPFRRHKHSVVVDERQRTVGAHHDVVGLDVAMGERLRAEPCRQFAETVAEHRHGVAVPVVGGNVRLHGVALHPVHQQHGKLVVVATAVNKQLVLQILHGRNIRRVDKLQFLGDLAVGLRTALLLLGKTFQGIALLRLLVLHLEHNGKRATATIRLTILVHHGHQMAQLLQVVVGITDGRHVF